MDGILVFVYARVFYEEILSIEETYVLKKESCGILLTINVEEIK